MKNKLPVFLILPVLLFVVSLTIKYSHGSYFTNYQYDPSYVYLISSLNLSQFSGVKHVDHPGTPMQIIGAVVIKLSYQFTGSEDSIAKDVLFNPEKYISVINLVCLVLNCLGLLILGIVSYNVYSNIFLSLLLQLTPFTSINIMESLALVRPENFLFFVVCILISILILLAGKKQFDYKSRIRYLILTGIICGLGIAAKLTFFPLVLIPLILFRGVKLKLIFMISVLMSFILFVLPVFSIYNINYFLLWISKLFLNSGNYGRGKANIIDFNSFSENVMRIFRSELIFDIAYVLVLFALILCLKPLFEKFIRTFKTKSLNSSNSRETYSNISNNQFKLAAGIFFAMTLQILIVAKHFGLHYMFSSLTISVFAIITSIRIITGSISKKLTTRNMNMIYMMVFFLISINGVFSIYNYTDQLNESKLEADKLIKYVSENSINAAVISTKLVSSPETALFGAITYAKPQVKNYKLILDEKYPESIIYYNDRCYSFGDDDKIENVFKSADKILFVCTEADSLSHLSGILMNIYNIPGPAFEKKFSNNNGEMVYEIIAGKSE